MAENKKNNVIATTEADAKYENTYAATSDLTDSASEAFNNIIYQRYKHTLKVNNNYPQIQTITQDHDGFFYVGCSDLNDNDAIILKYNSDFQLIKSKVITGGGHGKVCFIPALNKLLLYPRKVGSNYNPNYYYIVSLDLETVSDKINDTNTLIMCYADGNDFYGTYSKSIYKLNWNADYSYTKEYFDTLPLDNGFMIDEHTQAFAINDNTIYAIRTCPNTLFIKSRNSSDITSLSFPVVSFGRTTGEVEGLIIIDNELYLLNQFYGDRARKNTICNLSVVPTNAFSNSYTHDTQLGTSGNATIYIAYDTENTFCDGTQNYPFHSIAEAVAFAKSYGYKSVYFNYLSGEKPTGEMLENIDLWDINGVIFNNINIGALSCSCCTNISLTNNTSLQSITAQNSTLAFNTCTIENATFTNCNILARSCTSTSANAWKATNCIINSDFSRIHANLSCVNISKIAYNLTGRHITGSWIVPITNATPKEITPNRIVGVKNGLTIEAPIISNYSSNFNRTLRFISANNDGSINLYTANISWDSAQNLFTLSSESDFTWYGLS